MVQSCFSSSFKTRTFSSSFQSPLYLLIYFAQEKVPHHFSSALSPPNPSFLFFFISIEAIFSSLISFFPFMHFSLSLLYYLILVHLLSFLLTCQALSFVFFIYSRSQSLFTPLTNCSSHFSLALLSNLLRWPPRNLLLHPLDKPTKCQMP